MCVDSHSYGEQYEHFVRPSGLNLSKNRQRETSGVVEHLLWCRGQRVSLDLVIRNGRTLSLLPQTVATTWCAGESQGRSKRAYVVSLPAICALTPPPAGTPTPEERVVQTPLAQAVLTLVREGRRVSVLSAGYELGGVVQTVDPQGLEISRPHSLGPGEERWMIPLDQLWGVALLEPGDSFPPSPRAVVSLERALVEGAWW